MSLRPPKVHPLENRPLRRDLERLRAVKRHMHHPLIHKIHKKHHISKKTLFYVKEYGPHSNVPNTIIRESAKILLLASVVSSIGGLALEHIKIIFVSIMPLVILMPTLNDMVGDYGSIVSSRFSTMLHRGVVKKRVWSHPELKTLIAQILIISTMTAAISAVVAVSVTYASTHVLDLSMALKIFIIAVVDIVLLVAILSVIAVYAGFYFFRKQEDPNNFLIPLTTSIGDFGNMILLSVLVVLVF